MSDRGPARDLQDELEPLFRKMWFETTGYWPPEVCTLEDPHLDKVLGELAWAAAQHVHPEAK